MKMTMPLALIAVVGVSACQTGRERTAIPQRAETGTIIISYDATADTNRRGIIDRVRDRKLRLVYDLRGTRTIVVGDVPGARLSAVMDEFRALPGVLAVEEDRTMQLHEAPR